MGYILAILTAFPTPPTGTPADMAAHGISFFSTWISRIGGLIAFAGAVKFGLSVKSEDGKEQLTGLLTMVSGFMIAVAVNSMHLFSLPETYSTAAATTEFRSIMSFIGVWIRRVGAAGMFIGGAMFGFGIKERNPVNKVSGLKVFAIGAIVESVAQILNSFI